MTDIPQILPIGTVLTLTDGNQPLMITSRTIQVHADESAEIYDYGACLYPEGVLGDTAIYFNHETVGQVLHLGYLTKQEQRLQQQLLSLRNDPVATKQLIDVIHEHR